MIKLNCKWSTWFSIGCKFMLKKWYNKFCFGSKHLHIYITILSFWNFDIVLETHAHDIRVNTPCLHEIIMQHCSEGLLLFFPGLLWKHASDLCHILTCTSVLLFLQVFQNSTTAWCGSWVPSWASCSLL